MGDLSVEPRSFTERRTVGELTPINLDGKTVKEALRAVLGGVHQTHACLEQHILEQRQALIDATERRQQLADELLVAKSLALDTRSEVRDLALAFGVRKPDKNEEVPKTNALATWGSKEVATAIAGIPVAVAAVIGAIAALWTLGHFLWPGVIPPAPSLKG